MINKSSSQPNATEPAQSIRPGNASQSPVQNQIKIRNPHASKNTQNKPIGKKGPNGGMGPKPTRPPKAQPKPPPPSVKPAPNIKEGPKPPPRCDTSKEDAIREENYVLDMMKIESTAGKVKATVAILEHWDSIDQFAYVDPDDVALAQHLRRLHASRVSGGDVDPQNTSLSS